METIFRGQLPLSAENTPCLRSCKPRSHTFRRQCRAHAIQHELRSCCLAYFFAACRAWCSGLPAVVFKLMNSCLNLRWQACRQLCIFMHY
ncbi:hypothetical protein DBR44_02675 [Aquitalea sp. FJL05]|nr:hypothetical protein DBR44_02675 [Aquitalea sp. FJL05]